MKNKYKIKKIFDIELCPEYIGIKLQVAIITQQKISTGLYYLVLVIIFADVQIYFFFFLTK